MPMGGPSSAAKHLTSGTCGDASSIPITDGIPDPRSRDQEEQVFSGLISVLPDALMVID